MFASIAALATLTSAPSDWEGRIIYQVFPRSYRDSDGDRVGDLNGIRQGLPLMKKLGASVVLINPILKSRNYHNYFADDFYKVDPSLGTNEDFKRLCRAAHKQGMKVVLDMELQYVADQHPWYIAAENGGLHRDFFLNNFPDDPFGKVTWWDGSKFRLATLNLNNPDVRANIIRAFRHWKKQGVDGFRIDHMMDDLDHKGIDKNLYQSLWTEVEKQVPAYYIGEQADWFVADAVDQIFAKSPTRAAYNFHLYGGLHDLKLKMIREALQKQLPPEHQMVNFLELHDISRYASVTDEPRKLRAAAAILFATPGMPLVYYGQELGMKGKQGKYGSDSNDIPVRLAYRWGATVQAKGTATWYRGTGPWDSAEFSHDHDGISLEEQDGDPLSLLNWYRKLGPLRASSASLTRGKTTVLERGPTIVAFDRGRVRVLANLSEDATTLTPEDEGFDLISRRRVATLGPWQVAYVRR